MVAILLLQPALALREGRSDSVGPKWPRSRDSVYALLLPSKHVDQDVKRLPLVDGYSWKRSEKSNTRAVIMTLTKDAAAPTLDSASRSVNDVK